MLDPSMDDVSAGPIFASIGTVLIDCFDTPPPPPTPSTSKPKLPTPKSLSSSLASLSTSSTSSLTPQRSFHSDDLMPSTNTSPGTSLSGSIPDEPESIEVLGGGALYSLVGARIWLPSSKCRTLVDVDENKSDLGEKQERELNEFGEECWGWVEGRGRRMIRARIRYEDGVRIYQHLVKPYPRSWDSLLGSAIDHADYLHISPPYSPEDVLKLCQQQLQSRNGEESGKNEWRPKIIFEPTPPSCHPGQKGFLEELLPHLEVLSPNHEELLSIYSHPIHPLSSPLLRPALEEIVNHLLQLGIGEKGDGAVVVRCGKLGSVIGTRKGGIEWVPAYWEEEDEWRVKDVTGGGFIAGLSISDNDPYEAALYGTVSASFIVEQIGLPKIEKYLPSLDLNLDSAELVKGEEKESTIPLPKSRSERHMEDRGGSRGVDVENERWNGDVPEVRLEDLRRRIRGGD